MAKTNKTTTKVGGAAAIAVAQSIGKSVLKSELKTLFHELALGKSVSQNIKRAIKLVMEIYGIPLSLAEKFVAKIAGHLRSKTHLVRNGLPANTALTGKPEVGHWLQPAGLTSLGSSSQSTKLMRSSGPPVAVAEGPMKLSHDLKTTKRNGQTCTVVSGVDYLGKIEGATGFNTLAWRINPGLPGVFNFISQIAQRYETYRCRKLVFHYIPSVGTQNAGNVMMFLDYDALDSIPSDERDFMTNANCVTKQIWDRCTYAADPKLLMSTREKYVRSGVPLESGDDVRLSDLGMFCIGFTDIDALDGVNIGRLYVEYEFELSTPSVDEVSLANSKTNLWYSQTGVDGNNPFGTSRDTSGDVGTMQNAVKGSAYTWYEDSTLLTDRLYFANPGIFTVIFMVSATTPGTQSWANYDGVTPLGTEVDFTNASRDVVVNSFIVDKAGANMEMTFTGGSGFDNMFLMVMETVSFYGSLQAPPPLTRGGVSITHGKDDAIIRLAGERRSISRSSSFVNIGELAAHVSAISR